MSARTAGRNGRLIASAACVGGQTREEGERVAPNLKIDSRVDALGAHFALDKESDPVPDRSSSPYKRQRFKAARS